MRFHRREHTMFLTAQQNSHLVDVLMVGQITRLLTEPIEAVIRLDRKETDEIIHRPDSQ